VHPRIGGRRDRTGNPSTALLSPLDQEEYFAKNVNPFACVNPGSGFAEVIE
jgi:hypothetical protein